MLALRLHALRSGLQLAVGFVVVQTDGEPVFARHTIKIGRIDLRAALELVRATCSHLAQQLLAHALEQIVLEDALLILQILA